MAAKRILFIEPVPALRQRIAGGLEHLRDRWELSFAGTQAEALDLMAASPVQAVVTDGSAGPALPFAREAARRCPGVIRVVQMDPAQKELRRECAESAVHCLPPGCEVSLIEEAVKRALLVDELMNNPAIKDLMAHMRTPPTLPELYRQILQHLQSPATSLEEVALLITNEPALCAKMIQMANSAFFGLSRQISTAFEAVMFLGLEQVKALVLYGHCVCLFDPRCCRAFSIDRLWRHCMTTASFARWITLEETGNTDLADGVFTAGLLHDMGKLMMAANVPDQYQRALALADRAQITDGEAERQSLGTTHAEVGACLLGLWGLPSSIVEAVVWHHAPRLSDPREFTPLTAVHVANTLAYEREPAQPSPTISQIDSDYMSALGLGDRCDIWRRICVIPTQETSV